ncbi:MAG: RecQ family ATP-dependent DNA helicase [Crocinitomix sp.]|nr:RecQ family ATP-dependent DNA helicase [Crocinitomix sp.]
MQNILFLDIETNQKGKIVDYGALFSGQELHEKHTTKLERWIAEAEYICGHNIIQHDIPELKKILCEEIFLGKKYIDTLLWSPLLFALNPYHKLVKGYKIVNEADANNPLSDCKLTRELLIDELNSFSKLDAKEQHVYFTLLSASFDFNAFFDFTNFTSNPRLTLDFHSLFGNNICSSAQLSKYESQMPVELAYAFALLRLGNEDSILPAWVRNIFPIAEHILEEIRFSACGRPYCSYCSEKLDHKKALLHYFEYPDFRKFEENRSISLQEETVRAGLQKQSFVAVFPTGGGKSLTFQLPALMRGESTKHLTVIISPLVSLMKDQVDNLKDRFGITKAVAINGLLSPLERQESVDMVADGRANLLYISPESLRSPTIYRLISSRSVARFVIDEAHCFSSWGQDFRVDYLYIADFIKLIETKKKIGSIPVSCFTATAKPQVIDDIKNYFKKRLDLDLKEFVTTKGRTNLSYEVIEVDDASRKMNYLLPLLHDCEKPVIIYASRTKTVQKVCELIQQANFNATFFHGQLDKDVKKANMEAFMNSEKDIIVATSAFGMGVDKEDVKTVIHYNISDSLENYVQEAGRAGRDEKIRAKCYILFNEEDLNKHFSLLQQTKLNQKEIKDIWGAIKNQAKYREKLSQSALEIAKKSGWDAEMRDLETRVKSAISALEDQGFLRRKQNSPRVFADSLMVRNFSQGKAKITQSKSISDIDKIDCEKVLKRIITDKEARVDYLADRTELSIYRVQGAIQMLRDLSILGDAKDLTAFINLNQSKKGSKQIIRKFIKIEKALIELLPNKSFKIPLRQWNQNLMDSGIQNSSAEDIRSILTYWDKRKFVKKRRTNKERDIYEVIILNKSDLFEDIKWRHDLCVSVMELFAESTKNEQKNQKEDVPVSFSLLNLRDQNQFMGTIVESNTKKYETTLLFMNDIKAIKLEGGFMVSYNKFNIDKIEKDRHHFTLKDYAKMDNHYKHKTEQIHIVGEYAKKSVQNYESALAFVNDYFTLSYDEFLAFHFPRRKTEIQRSLTPARFEEVIKDLDTDQTKILADNKSENILVLAGPGSGKTKVLVHKIASLLLLEDIKPEQFLMLTFSKAAAIEFKNRIRSLIPEFAGLIKITTFHGFCFQLLGQLGDLEKSQNVIQDCIKAIENDEIDVSSISNKSVLLFDEFQDINGDEWNLIKTIIKVAEKPRTIAVGDDDQNIYEFRGSSNKYMNDFRQNFNATVYTLPKNYRSRAGIIQFNNLVLNKLNNRMKRQTLVPAKHTLKAKIRLVNYKGNHLEKPLVENLHNLQLEGVKAVLTRTNHEALLISSMLTELGYKTRLLAGFDGFTMSVLDEIRFFSTQIKKSTGDSGIIFETEWLDTIDTFRAHFKNNRLLETCLEVIYNFQKAYPDNKLLVDWWEYIREIKMEDAIHTNSKSIIVSTMHKSKGKEFDHVFMLVEDFESQTDASKRLLYVASTRAKESLHIHTNTSFYENFEFDELNISNFQGELKESGYYELILNHKEVNLGSQKYPRAARIIQNLQTDEALIKDIMKFKDSEASGLAKLGAGNMLLFSKDFINRKLIPFQDRGYELVSAKVEYLVYWYDPKEEREYKIVLPRLRFEKTADSSE